MCVRVVADLMSRRRDLAAKLRVALELVSCQVERRPDLLRGQCAHYLLRSARVWPVVKGQCHDLGLCVDAVRESAADLEAAGIAQLELSERQQSERDQAKAEPCGNDASLATGAGPHDRHAQMMPVPLGRQSPQSSWWAGTPMLRP